MLILVSDPLPLVVETPGDVDRLVAAAEQAASLWRLGPPELIRVGANGVSECGDVVLRVGRSTAHMGVTLRFAERVAAAVAVRPATTPSTLLLTRRDHAA